MTAPNTILELQQENKRLKQSIQDEREKRLQAERRLAVYEQRVDALVKKLTAGLL